MTAESRSGFIERQLGLEHRGELVSEALNRYTRIMLAFNASDMKPAFFLLGLTQQPSSPTEIYSRVARRIDPTIWLPSISDLTNSYLKGSFLDVDFVEQTRKDRNIFFETTEDGELLGKPSAALMLKYTAEHAHTFSEIMGKKSRIDVSNNPFINRTKVLLALADKPSFEAELTRTTGVIKPSMKGILKTLNHLGLIDYRSVDTEKSGWVVYQRIGDVSQTEHKADMNRLRRNVIKYFELNDSGNMQTIAKAIGRQFEGDIIEILTELINQGTVRRVDYEGAKKQSDAKITPLGEEFVRSAIVPILLACAGDPIQQRALYQVKEEALTDPIMVNRALLNYARSSNFHNRVSATELQDSILRYVEANGPTRYQQVVNDLGRSTYHELKKLVEAGKLVKHTDGKAVFYRLPEMDPINRPNRVTIFEYTPPADLVPLDERKKEEYRADLETMQFWEKLAADLQNISGNITEQRFFSRYDPENNRWMAEDNYKSGKYINLVLALRKLGFSNPYRFIREYVPENKDLVEVVKLTQEIALQKLIPTKDNIRFEERIRSLEDQEFWIEFGGDLNTFISGETFGNFLRNFTEQNRFANVILEPEEKRDKGKYFDFYGTFKKHQLDILKSAHLNDLPEEMQKSFMRTLSMLFFSAAPAEIRKLLLEKFPTDFSNVRFLNKDYTPEEEELLTTSETLYGPDEVIPADKDIFSDVVSDDAVALYLKEAGNTPRISHEVEVKLFKKISEGKEAEAQLDTVKVSRRARKHLENTVLEGNRAFDSILKSNLRLVIWQAKRYQNRGLPLLDLIQEGNIALMNTINSFDYKLGFKFSTYAVNGLKWNLTKGIDNLGETIRKPVHFKSLQRKVYRTTKELEQRLGHSPSYQEIGDELEIPADRIEQISMEARDTVSLQTPVGDQDNSEIGDFIADERNNEIFERVEESQLPRLVRDVLGELDERSKMILKLRFGLEGDDALSLEEIGIQYGLSRERIRQIERDALKIIRSKLAGKLIDYT